MECVKTIKMSIWWSFAHKRPSIVYKISSVLAVLMGNQPKGLQCNLRQRMCKLCSNRSLDSTKHILFECDSLAMYRNTHLSVVTNSMPTGMRNSFLSLPDDKKLELLLSGLHCNSLIEEWDNIMRNICEYVHGIYWERKMKYDNLMTIEMT